MRHIGTLPDEGAARTFHDYLLAHGVPSQIEAEGDGAGAWSLWIINEDQVADARDRLARFRASPEAPEYAEAAGRAESIRREQARREKAIRKKAVDVRSRWERPIYSRAPATTALLALSLLTAAVTTDWADPGNLCDRLESTTHLFIAPVHEGVQGKYWYPGEGLGAIRGGQVWRLFTPIFLHFHPLHIIFNMLLLMRLGVGVELRRGRWKMLWFVALIAATSNLAQYLAGGPMFGGMSGVVYGLFGYIWMQSKFDPFSGFFMPPNLVFVLMGWFVLCLTGVVGNVANTAHAVGLGVGALLGVTGPLLLRRR